MSFYVYPFLVATLVGWISMLLKADAQEIGIQPGETLNVGEEAQG